MGLKELFEDKEKQARLLELEKKATSSKNDKAQFKRELLACATELKINRFKGELNLNDLELYERLKEKIGTRIMRKRFDGRHEKKLRIRDIFRENSIQADEQTLEICRGLTRADEIAACGIIARGGYRIGRKAVIDQNTKAHEQMKQLRRQMKRFTKGLNRSMKLLTKAIAIKQKALQSKS